MPQGAIRAVRISFVFIDLIRAPCETTLFFSLRLLSFMVHSVALLSLEMVRRYHYSQTAGHGSVKTAKHDGYRPH